MRNIGEFSIDVTFSNKAKEALNKIDKHEKESLKNSEKKTKALKLNDATKKKELETTRKLSRASKGIGKVRVPSVKGVVPKTKAKVATVKGVVQKTKPKVVTVKDATPKTKVHASKLKAEINNKQNLLKLLTRIEKQLKKSEKIVKKQGKEQTKQAKAKSKTAKKEKKQAEEVTKELSKRAKILAKINTLNKKALGLVGKGVKGTARAGASKAKDLTKTTLFGLGAAGAYAAVKGLGYADSIEQGIEKLKTSLPSITEAHIRKVIDSISTVTTADGKRVTRMSEADTIVALGDFVDRLKSMGYNQAAAFRSAEKYIISSVDTKAFKDKDLDEVIYAFQSAVTGERESLKSSGIVLLESDITEEVLKIVNREYKRKDGIQGAIDKKFINKQFSNDVIKLLKARATEVLIHKAVADARGQFAKEAGSYGNQLLQAASNLKDRTADLGEAVMPLALSALTKLNKWLRDMGSGEKLKNKLDSMVAGVLDFYNDMKLLVLDMKLFFAKASRVMDAFSEFNPLSMGAFKEAMKIKSQEEIAIERKIDDFKKNKATNLNQVINNITNNNTTIGGVGSDPMRRAEVKMGR